MTPEQLRAQVLEELRHIAPELEAQELRGDRLLRDEVDLDSMDWLRFIAALHRRLGVDIPESDYQRLGSLDAIVDYLHGRLA